MLGIRFPREWCDAALAKCGRTNLEKAITFCFENSADMDAMVSQYLEKLKAEKGTDKSKKKLLVNPQLEQLSEMGIPLRWC